MHSGLKKTASSNPATNNIPALTPTAILKNYISPPANACECNHFEPLPEGIATDATVYAGKGYDSKASREHLQRKQLSDGIMHKAHRVAP